MGTNMNSFATIKLGPHGWEFRCPTANLSEDRPLAADDVQRLQDWAGRYHQAAGARDQSALLLQIGREMYAWVNGTNTFLDRLKKKVRPPLVMEFAIEADNVSEAAHAFLDAPWELLAAMDEHWALNRNISFCPVRRIGEPVPPPPLPDHRLGVVFMAAAPRNADNLDYEGEEAAILNATGKLGLDLTVEESGTLELLSAGVAREQPEVIQISSHGTLHPRPGLLLEDDLGDAQFVSADALLDELAGYHPRLLILSACETAQADPVLPSLARALVYAGVPAVLGWAAPVLDKEATIFAAELYRRLTQGKDLADSLASSRRALASSGQLAPDGSRDWHLARLFLSANGGGALARAGGPSRHLGQGQAVKTFLDAKGQQVPVAGELEFVGRRREIQDILREFRAPARRHAGVFIHGVGRQGKSSLAARVARRLEHTHETVVIFGRYDAPFILRTLGERLGTPAVTEIVARHLPLVEADKSKLQPALTELLKGPCAQAGGQGAKPVLLVLDDFEQALNKRDHRTLKPEYFDSIRALLLAFQSARTESHLLFTCRYQFTCPNGAQDLADANHLLDVPLRGMNDREARKQADAKRRLQVAAKLTPAALAALDDRLDRIIQNARGNPGLQDLLFSLALDNAATCDECLAGMEKYLEQGTMPAAEKVREFLENLALESLLGLLTAGERELLRASTLFELPVPEAVMATLSQYICSSRREEAHNSGGESQRLLTSAATIRLVGLGLWEVYEDLHAAQTRALAINALVRPQAGALNDAEQAGLAAGVVGELFERWGGETGGKRRGYLQDYELTRLGLFAKDARVLASTGADALRFLDDRFEYRTAAEWAKEIVAIVGESASVALLRTAAERCQQVGEVTEANTFRERAMKFIGQGGETDIENHAAMLLTQARALVQQGQPDEALRHLEQAKILLPPGREQAIVLGDIARIRADKGDVDAALQLHQERLAIYEALGDKRERAVTLGDIARIRTAKGDVDAAVQLQNERLAVNHELGDQDGIAAATYDLAQIEIQQEKWPEAFEHLAEAYDIFNKIGRLDFICTVDSSLGLLLCRAGQREQGLQMLTRSRDGFAKLGLQDHAKQTEAIIAHFSQSAG